MYVPMSTMQKKLYANLLKKDVDAINGAEPTFQISKFGAWTPEPET
jgi:hypothetical protein